jgi:lysophospholipase L1-like esterase
VHNHAASGRSTRSFVREGRWQAVLDSIQRGDYVVIQFGHNDEKPDSLLHTDPFTSYKQHLVKFVSETRAKGGIPVICSPIVRRHFDGSGNLVNTHGDYPLAARSAAADTKTAFVDMEAGSHDLIQKLGPEGSKSLFVFCAPGQCPRRPRGVQDSTHLNHEGVVQVARLFAEGVRKAALPLAKELK